MLDEIEGTFQAQSRCFNLLAAAPRPAGPWAIRQMNDPRARTPIIVFTANTMEGDREALVAAGMDDCVAKPINEAELLQALANCGASSASQVPRTSSSEK